MNKHTRAKRSGGVDARLRWPGLLVICLALGACAGMASHQRGGGEGKAGQILLSVTPFEEPSAASVSLREQGEAEFVRYVPAQLSVSEVRRGRLPGAETARLQARGAALRSALAGGGFAGTGFEEGDLFQLSLGPGGPAASGLVHKAPRELQDFFRDLLSLEGRLDKARPAEAYVRAETIDPGRLDALRRRGAVRLLPLGDFPADLRPALAQAAGSPLRFFPLSRAQYERLLAFCSHGRELFVLDRDAGHQLALYTSRP